MGDDARGNLAGPVHYQWGREGALPVGVLFAMTRMFGFFCVCSAIVLWLPASSEGLVPQLIGGKRSTATLFSLADVVNHGSVTLLGVELNVLHRLLAALANRLLVLLQTRRQPPFAGC